uniref:leucine-rich repeat neuronal protein 2 n=1 Tax=Doryrhamphus excisus TaxID=161450 RepID=UPI0025AE9C58|nr:leucine-rich repeat neuronal protein 2 [Doryrhamphus excisus]XP_057910461.1 leucine-rich repeat neuronal protein 2 [Doryrhamphus excisus]
MLMLLRSQCLLCVLVGVFTLGAAAMLPQALPWHVPCPEKCVCHIKPWFSPDSVYHEAPTVDCNDQLLTSPPCLLPLNTHTLHLQGNNLSVLDAAALHGLPNLTDLDLSQNHFNCVRAVTQNLALSSLLSLHLEENHLRHLPDASFSSLPALQELFLSHNDLSSISPGAFSGLDSLLRLHMNNNKLTTVDPKWFGDLRHLQVLMLGGNPVETLPEKGFLALRSLRSLVLGGMGLRSLADNALDGLDALESLSFYDNLLTKVPTQALQRVKGLKFLDLNKNRIKLIETGDFKDMVHLKELGLNNMEELMSIEKASLENLPELTKLEITNNPRLSFIHPQAFYHLSRLESLMLNTNALSALHYHVMLSLPKLQEVSLHSNPLRCDCLFHWAAQVASHSRTSRIVRFIQPQATLCSEPRELKSRKVRDVSSREMSAVCIPSIPTASLPSSVGVREGAKLLLHCRALADPHPQLYWVTPSGLRLGAASGNATASKRYNLSLEGTLEIRKITSRDAGLYTCVAENALGADTRSVTVTVHGKVNARKRRVRSNLKSRSLITDSKLDLVEVGGHFAVVSWQNKRNFPSARLSWQAVSADARAPAFTTRILAGTRSFNVTHLQAETFYRVCLHLGSDDGGGGAKHGSRRSKTSRKTQCVSFGTDKAAETRGGLRLSPEMASTAATMIMILVLMLMLMVGHAGHGGQGWENGKHNGAFFQEMKSHKGLIDEKRSEKLLFHHDC